MTTKLVPREPTMGQWDDFCKVHPIRFDKFILAYKAAIAAAPADPSVEPVAWVEGCSTEISDKLADDSVRYEATRICAADNGRVLGWVMEEFLGHLRALAAPQRESERAAGWIAAREACAQVCEQLYEGNFDEDEPMDAIDSAWNRFNQELSDGPDSPYPGMAKAFEAHTGQSWRDKDWRSETAIWAAAWKAAVRAPISQRERAAMAEEFARVCEEEICNCCWNDDAQAAAEQCAAAIRALAAPPSSAISEKRA